MPFSKVRPDLPDEVTSDLAGNSLARVIPVSFYQIGICNGLDVFGKGHILLHL